MKQDELLNENKLTGTHSPSVLELRGIRQTYFDTKTQKDFVVFDNFNRTFRQRIGGMNAKMDEAGGV